MVEPLQKYARIRVCPRFFELLVSLKTMLRFRDLLRPRPTEISPFWGGDGMGELKMNEEMRSGEKGENKRKQKGG